MRTGIRPYSPFQHSHSSALLRTPSQALAQALQVLLSLPTSSFERKVKTKRGQRKNQNEKYRLKYLRLRKAARTMIFENAALCDEIAHLEEKFLRAKEERRYILSMITGCCFMMNVPSTPWASAAPVCCQYEKP
uniref:INO80 complex subunit E N-terminal domain-containing protein n=1 Tax=Neogobius melanostomus TaxID=47308 RepID=A0A8C6T4I7_9GOBI